jgi:hypothetical protein
LGLLQSRTPSSSGEGLTSRLGPAWLALTALVFVMVLSGALVAGIRMPGLAYNSFPADERAFPAA